jgi:hypothetical protein
MAARDRSRPLAKPFQPEYFATDWTDQFFTRSVA